MPDFEGGKAAERLAWDDGELVIAPQPEPDDEDE